ncbi:MAG: MerR family transcriptional regulator [Firmicutes bacterium]|nr:MerR family transcriptional regulator [Bacillota bacterium]
MRIGELAQRTGVSTRAIRYYDQCELLHPQRQPNQYRDYEESCVTRVEQIQLLLGLGFTVAMIRLLLPCTMSTPQKLRRCPRTQSALYDQLGEIDRKLADLGRLRTRVAETLRITTEDMTDGLDEEILNGPSV